MESATHQDAVMCLVSQEGNIELHIRRTPPSGSLGQFVSHVIYRDTECMLGSHVEEETCMWWVVI